MDILFEEYRDRLTRRKRHPHTIELFDYAVKHYEEALEVVGATVTTVKPWQVEEIFSDLHHSYGTKKSILQHVRSAYEYGRKRGRIDLDPTYDVDLGRPPEAEPVVIPTPELRIIRDACWKPDDYLLFHILAYTGMREFEIRKMEWGDVNLKTGFIRIVGKAQKLRKTPIHPLLGEILASRRYHLGQRVIRNVYWRRLQTVAPGRSFHDFRKTAATSLAANDVPDPVIDQMFGWAPRSIGRKFYIRATDEKMQQAILALYRDDPI